MLIVLTIVLIVFAFRFSAHSRAISGGMSKTAAGQITSGQK
jgi:hypothetical protein